MSGSEKPPSTVNQNEPQPSSEPTDPTPSPLEPEKGVSEIILFWLNIDGSFSIDYRLLIG